MPGAIKIFSSVEAAERALPLNQPRKMVLDGRPFCLLNAGSAIVIMDDACPHMGASLSDGRTNAYGEIICPLHEYRYDLQTGRESQNRCKDLRIYKVAMGNEGVMLHIEPDR